jgi:RHS repeat-associated protein
MDVPRFPDSQAETDLAGNVLENYIFFDGQRIARRDGATKAVHFYFSDHLGTHGVVENATGTACEQDTDYYPYGGVEHDYCPNTAQNYKFTGKERDAETQNDDFGARYYSASFGRWLSADWSEDPDPLPYADLANPQELNLYSMVTNNPQSFADPDGHDADAGSMESSAASDSATAMADEAGPGVPVKPAPLVIDKIVITVQATAETVGTTLADVVGGIIVTGLYLISPQGGDHRELDAEHRAQQWLAEKKAEDKSSEPKAAAGGNGKKGLPPGARKLRGGQGYRDKKGNIWKKDQLHKDHWDVMDRNGNKIREVTFDGRELWPNGPKNNNK